MVSKIKKDLNVYSTNENLVGTWINGDPIYRKVYTGRTSPSTINTLIDSSFNSNNKKVIKAEGWVGTMQIGGDLGGDGTSYFTGTYVTGSGLYLYCGSSLRNEDYVLIIEYTKKS